MYQMTKDEQNKSDDTKVSLANGIARFNMNKDHAFPDVCKQGDAYLYECNTI